MLAILAIAVLALLLVCWNSLAWPRVGHEPAPPEPAVSVLIPARNEQDNIRSCLDTLRDQGGCLKEVVVYDDHSEDRTPDIVRETTADWPSLRLAEPVPLPDGWHGKAFACSHLASLAQGEWLLFLDADARLSPRAVGRMLAEARRRGVTFLSCWPGLELHGFWEKALMPMLNFIVFTLFPAPLSFRMRRPSLGLAHGACILAHRGTYHRIGGHGLVRRELFEDTALARAWRAAGESGLCLDGQYVVRVRMYDSFAGIWKGFQKNIYPAFKHDISFWLFLLFHFVVFLLPFAAVWAFTSPWVWGAAACVLAMRAVQALRFDYPAWSVLLHPAAEVAMIAQALTSWYKCRAHRGIEWKGRTYRGR